MQRYNVSNYIPRFIDSANYLEPSIVSSTIHNEDDTVSTPSLVDNFIIKSGMPFIMNS